MVLPRLKDVVELSDLAQRVYRYLQPQEYVGKLAPSLGMILQKDLGIASIEVSSELLDPIKFLSITYFRKPLVEALRTVNTSLQSVSGIVPVLSLTHAMGLGKTHFLTLLYHLYTKAPRNWDEIKRELPEEAAILVEEANYKTDVARRTLVITIDMKYIPSDLPPYEALFLNLLRIFEKYKKDEYLALKADKDAVNAFEETVQKLHKYEPKDAARELVKVLLRFGITVPVLTIVDEVYAAVFEALVGASNEYANSVKNVVMFLAALVDELSGKFPAILVYASAMQDVQRWRDVARLPVEAAKELLKEAVKYFEQRTHRVSPISVKDVDEDEAIEIVRKRIIRMRAPLDKVLSDETVEKLRSSLSEVVGGAEADRFVYELRKTYPFSPMYKELVRKLIVPAFSADFAPEKLQHLRDLIKISSSIVGRVLESDEAYLVSIVHIEHDDIKHLLDEAVANEWRKNALSWNIFLQHLEARTKDPDLVKMVKGAISAIYIKSVTNNPWDLMLMMTKKPDTLTLEELDRRTLLQKRLLLALTGIVDLAKLSKYSEVFEILATTPYIHSVERGEGKYYYASLFENPYQLIRDIHESEIRKLRDEEGKLKVKEAIEYVRNALEEYALVSEFKRAKDRKDTQLSVEIVSSTDFDETSAKFIEYLNDKDEFTILVVSPIDVANKLLMEGLSFESLIKGFKECLDKNKNKIKNLNMFAVVVPYIDEETLERLVNSLAEIRASEMVVNMLKTERDVMEFAERTVQRHRTLVDLVRKPEDEFKRIVMEIIALFREKLETYAQQLNNAAVQNFTSDFVGLFKKIITYNPSTGRIEVADLAVSIGQQPQTLSKVFASLPVWIVNAVRGKLQIVGTSDISAKLVDWIKKVVSTDVVREALRKNKEYRYSISTIVEALTKGWPDIPVKPESLNSVRNAIEGLLKGKVVQTDDRDFKLIEIDVEGDDLILRPRELVYPPAPVKPIKGVAGFEVTGVDNVNIALGSIVRDKEFVQLADSIHITIRAGSSAKPDAEISIKGSPNMISELADPIIKYLNRHRNDISYCGLRITLAKMFEENDAQQLIKRIGLPLAKIRLLESQG